jgi:hypothetical protein
MPEALSRETKMLLDEFGQPIHTVHLNDLGPQGNFKTFHRMVHANCLESPPYRRPNLDGCRHRGRGRFGIVIHGKLGDLELASWRRCRDDPDFS